MSIPPKGGCGCLMSPPCLESQGCHLIPLCYLLSCVSASSCYSVCLIFFCLPVHSSELFPQNSSVFFVKRSAFFCGSCWAARRSKLVGGMCSMLPYDTGIFYYAFIHYLNFFIASVHSFFYTSFKSGIDKWTEWSTIPACPSLMWFVNSGDDTKGTNSSKILRLIFVYALF